MERGRTDQRPRLIAPKLDGRELCDLPPIALAGWDGGTAQLATEARLAHDGDRLHVGFRCRYAELHVDRALPFNAPAAGLWHHDVVEIFVSDRPEGRPYREIEASPLGQWLALAFVDRRVPTSEPWRMRPQVAATIGADQFSVELTLPLDELRTCRELEPDWRIGLYRIAGRPPDRCHLAHRPNGSPEPDFHQPETWAPLTIG